VRISEERNTFRNMDIEQLNSELQKAERDLLDYRFDAGLNRLVNPAGIHNTRKRIARLKTLIREKEILEASGFSNLESYKAAKIAERRAYKLEKQAR
jgi:large subunit ribosomal protein L29